MSFHTRLGSIAVAASLAILAGCSSNGSQVPATSQSIIQHQGAPVQLASLHLGSGLSRAAYGRMMPSTRVTPTWFANPSGVKNGIFVVDYSSNSVEIFDRVTKKQIGTIGGLNGPQGITTDPTTTDNKVYVADSLNHEINVYTAPYTSNPTKIQEPNLMYPGGMHVDTHGNLWVANICSGNGGNCTGDGSAVEYKQGKGTPITLNGAPNRVYFITSNANGDVWADGITNEGQVIVGYWSHGTGTFNPVNISIVWPGGLAFDHQGNLLLDDQAGSSLGGSIINVYPPGQTTPSRTITIQTNGDDFMDFAFGAKDMLIFAPEYGDAFGDPSGPTNIVTYPAGVMMRSTLPSTGTPDAVVVVPGPRP